MRIAVYQAEGTLVVAEQIVKDACWLDTLSRTAAESGCDDLTTHGIAQVRQNHLTAGYYTQHRLNQDHGMYWEGKVKGRKRITKDVAGGENESRKRRSAGGVRSTAPRGCRDAFQLEVGRGDSPRS